MPKNAVKVKVINHNKQLPEYKTSGAAAMDICCLGGVYLAPMQVEVVDTGLFVEVPEGYELQIRPRSGLACEGVTVLNSPGTIDSDYRGEIKVIMMNFGYAPFIFQSGDRIAQMVLSKVEKIEWEDVEHIEELTKTERGENGFGSTGV